MLWNRLAVCTHELYNVKKYVHLGHIISVQLDDKDGILAKRNSVCGKINNVLCLTIWDHVTHWWKWSCWGITVVIFMVVLFGIYHITQYMIFVWHGERGCDAYCHSRTIHTRDWYLQFVTSSPLQELICRCASFIMKCLNSCNSVVHSVSHNGIYGMRMHSPIGANVQFCCNYYGMSPNDIPYVSKRLAWIVFCNSAIAPDLDKINLIKELFKCKVSQRSDFIILRVRSWFYDMVFMYFIMYFLCIFVYFLFFHIMFLFVYLVVRIS